jgi:hypothetical protein
MISHVKELKMSEGNDLSQHILPTSAQLVGVCITVISLLKVLHIGKVESLLDKFLAIDALIFTASAVLSYISMREAKSAYLEKYADQLFLIGLLELGCCAVMLSFELI